MDATTRPMTALTLPQVQAALIALLDRAGPAAIAVQWRLVGTAAALVQGVGLPVGDIDLLFRERSGVDAFARALAGCPPVEPLAYLDDARQYFGSWDVGGAEVELSTVEWETDSDAAECIGRGPWEHFVVIACGPHQVPAVALEMRLAVELSRSRAECSEPLLAHLRAHGFDRALLARSFAAYRLPEALQAEVLGRLGA